MTKKIVAGLVAHVDAGKTTLTEALLYQSGQLRKLGRVDNGDAFLDPDQLEKQRGITIFTHQASLNYNDLTLTLLDTPGHIDFAAQTEQVLQVLDYAVLVVSATDGIQGYTRTLWSLLRRYHVPTFIFVNKVDSVGADVESTISALQSEFSAGCINFTADAITTGDTAEAIAMQDDAALEKFLDSGSLNPEVVTDLIRRELVFPVYTGSALKMDGIQDLLDDLDQWTTERDTDEEFSARVFKISHDQNGNRLTWVRVLGGCLKAKQEIFPGEKADQIRVYDGEKFNISQEIISGDVCAIAGLTFSYPGQGLGKLEDNPQAQLQPVLSYAVDTGEYDPHKCLKALEELADEDPQLNVEWSSHLQEIHVRLMGEVQREILEQLLVERFDLPLKFSQGQILYRETIDKPVEGVGHFEPLRHYAEVHLHIEPGEPGSGVQFANKCRIEVLDHNWQTQVMTSLAAKEHLGVLTGSPLTDVKITLVGGKIKIHSSGGDFREATWRAVRQGLMELAQDGHVKLLEPIYSYRLAVPQDAVGRAINDVQSMNGTFELSQNENGPFAIITGTAPVSTMRDYATEVRNYTHGQGQLDCVFDGYAPCHNTDEVIADADYNPTADLDNTPDSVFCAHGDGFPVKWDQVPEYAHFPYMK
ncbi:MAG: TetM/TetW/TetO/TetS family tetracycline resistance ribosomal protection protein [Limosilactobacillus sp.]|uniref:translation factor GTPase family protein n=1 Tax=Limosilactobacillus sp. TaxID=2773925 RepID=UPI0027078C0C|nr:TetM/TetW/TetO/TetS family tetracycline resistance ribosomal protection protein [Limosilactobacillus sp.]